MILVTGGTGFLGAHLLTHLLQAGEEVRCIYRSKPFKYLPQNIVEKIEWVRGDVLDVVLLENALQGIDRVYHCAGKVSYDPADKQDLYKVNVEGTANVINCCINKKIKKIVNVSSVAAIGRSKPNTPIDETAAWEEHANDTAYAKSKYLAEMEVWRGEAEGLSTVIVNPSLIIGPSLFWAEGAPKLIKNIADGFSFYTTGITGFTDARDVARLMIILMDAPVSGERFIINTENWSYKKLFLTIRDQLGMNTRFKQAGILMSAIVWRVVWLKSLLTGSKRLITKETARKASQKVFFSNKKISDFLPSFHWIPLKKTIADTCKAYLNQQEP